MNKANALLQRNLWKKWHKNTLALENARVRQEIRALTLILELNINIYLGVKNGNSKIN